MKRLLPLLAAALMLTGCQTVQRVDAGADVHAFLVAVRDNDKATFDAHVDRVALTRSLEGRLVQQVRDSRLDKNGQLIGAVLAAPVAKLATDTLVRPSVFRTVALLMGYSPDRPIPGQFVIASALRYTGSDTVCAPSGKDKPCLLTFTREDGVWKLSSYDGDLGTLVR